MAESFDGLKPLYAIYKYRLPGAIRKGVSSLATCRIMAPIRNRVLSRIDSHSAYLLSGIEKYSGVNFKSVIISNGPTARYLASIIYAENLAIKEIGHEFLHNTKSKSTACSSFGKIDLILAETNTSSSQFLPTDKSIILPRLVGFTLDLSYPLEIIFSKLNRRRRRSIRTIEKLGYSFEVTHDQAKFNIFYHKMYYPHLIKKYHELARPESFAYLKQLFKSGGLLLVKRNNRYTSGILYCLQNETVWTPSMGVSEENHEYVKQTASDALIYFLILWSKKQGHKRLDYGNTQPFLNDGLFRYKREWQMKAQKREEKVILARLCNFGKGIRSFLANNPFVFVDRKRLKGCIFVNHENPITEGEVRHLFRRYYTSGMSSLVVLSNSGFVRKEGSKATDPAPNSFSNLFEVARKAGQDLNCLEIKEERALEI